MGSIDDPNELASLSDVESVFSLSSVTVNNVRPKKTSTTLKPPLLKQQSSVASKRSDRDSARKPKEEDDSVFKVCLFITWQEGNECHYYRSAETSSRTRPPRRTG